MSFDRFAAGRSGRSRSGAIVATGISLPLPPSAGPGTFAAAFADVVLDIANRGRTPTRLWLGKKGGVD